MLVPGFAGGIPPSFGPRKAGSLDFQSFLEMRGQECDTDRMADLGSNELQQPDHSATPTGTGLTLFQAFLNNIADAGRELLESRDKRARSNIVTLCNDLLSQKGEALGTALARELVLRYTSLTPAKQLDFFRMLRAKFDVDHAAIRHAIEAYQANSTTENAQSLSNASEGKRRKLLCAINLAPGGTSVLIRMREDLQRLLCEEPELAPVDADFLTTLSAWFNRGFLELQRIDWGTPAKILEKLIQYEAVHAIRGWEDLRRRLEADRRCYAFFHPALPYEPLIFVEVALTTGLAASIQTLLDDKREPGEPTQADTAIFYSISNCQDGLRGISFGNFLIKQVVSDLQAELPRLKAFATLSPIPDFGHWLGRIRSSGQFPKGFTLSDRQALSCLDRANWHTNPRLVQRLKNPLMSLAAHFLLNMKQENRPMDSVARFHLGNGARIERLNWLADVSKQGIEESAGLMANYLYDVRRIERYHEAYANVGMIACSRAVSSLAPRSS